MINTIYKYNYHKVISLIVTDKTGITNSGIPCLSKYPEPFYNVAILLVALTLVVYKLFGSVNEV